MGAPGKLVEKTPLEIAQFNKQVEDDRRAREQWERDLYQNAPKELKDTDPDWADQMKEVYDRWADKEGLAAARRIPADTFSRVSSRRPSRTPAPFCARASHNGRQTRAP